MQKNELIIQGYKVNNMKKDVYNLTKPQMSIYMTEKFSNDSTNNIMGSIYFKSDIDVET